MANFLQTLLSGASALAPAAQRPGLTPEWFAGVMEEPVSQAPRAPVNLLEGIEAFNTGGAPNAAPDVGEQFEAPRQPRERRSVLDTVGRIADVLARVGGAEALYQPTLDARQDREFAIEDRQRAIDLDALKTALTRQQIQQGENELADAGLGKVGLAVRGLQAIQARGGNTAQAWPVLAQQIGLDPERTRVIGEAIATDPNAVFGLNAALNGAQTQGTQAKEAQIYEMLNRQDPELGKAYLQSIANPDAMTEYQRAQLGLSQERNDISRIRATRPPATRATGAAAAKAAAAEEAATAGRAQASNILGELRTTYNSLRNMGAMVSPQNSALGNITARVRASGVGQLAEGAVGTEAQALRDRVASIRPALMQSIAKATGMTGKQLDSNADVKLFMQTVTDPTASYEANIAAIERLERFLGENQPKAQRPTPSGARTRPPARRQQTRAPARSGGAKPSVSNW